MTAYSNTSPYSKTMMTNGYDVPFMITGRYMHRPDKLADELYGDSGLWWVFAVRNKEVIKDSIYDMIPGQIIFIPKLSTIKRAIGST